MYIRFADPEVIRVLLANNIGDGIGVSVQDAATANLGGIFKNNTTIESFNELQYFSKTLNEGEFSGCSSLKSVTLSDSPTVLNRSIFASTAITSINIPVGYTTIRQNCFNRCSSLTQVSIPFTLTSSEDYAFGNCDALDRVDITDLNAWCGITFGNASSNPLYHAKQLYLNNTLVTTVDLTNITAVKQHVFENLESLTSVTNFSGLTMIGESAFNGCINLVIADLNLPNLTILGSYAFKGTKLQAISSLGNITALSRGCFSNCLSLTSVDLPSSVTTIEQEAFYGCRNLTTINLTNITTLGASALNGCSLSRFNGPNSTVGEINLPNLTGKLNDSALKNLSQYAPAQIIYNITSLGTITEIGAWCFGANKIETIHIPSTVTKIGSNAFMNCEYVHDIYWEGTMNQWVNIDFGGGGANPCGRSSVNFYVNGTSPTSYTFPSGTTTIKKFALEGVKGLTSVTIPNGVTSIGQSAFRGCSDLTSINIPNSVTSIDDTAFYGCSNLTSITIPSSVTSISGGAFYDCAALTSITIPDNVTSDVDQWFHSCDALTTVVLGSGITRIKAWAFRNDKALRSLTVRAVNPPVCEHNALEQSAVVGLYNNYCDIYVPAGSVDAYKTADGWSAAASRIYAIPTT